jgi:hypothetical protein
LKKHSYDLPVAHTPVLSFPICGAMLAIWHLRPSLQRRFPLHHHLAKDWWGLVVQRQLKMVFGDN